MIRHHLTNRGLGLYVGGMVLGGFGVLAGSLVGRPWTELSGTEVRLCLVFGALVILSEARPLTWLNKGEAGGESTASWAFGMALLLMVPPAFAFLAMGVGSCLVDLLRGRPLQRTAFNFAQIVLSLAAASVVISLLTSRDPDMSDGWTVLVWVAAALVAGIVSIFANSVLTCVAIALSQGLSVVSVIRSAVGVNLAMDGLLVALAPIFVVVARESLVLVPLLVVTTVSIYMSAQLALNHRHEAIHDQLTGLPNRRYFGQQVQFALQSAARHHRPMAVIHIDLDGFKGINDRLGHHVGDLVLIEVATRLEEAKRSGDVLARLGGDEFAILLTRVEGKEQAVQVSQRLRGAICEPLDVEGVPISVGGSFGVAMFPDHGEDLVTLIGHADVAMYRAKTVGGGVAMYEPEGDRNGQGKLGLLADLPEALDSGQLFVEYQPKLDLASNRVTSVEALLRWDHPTLGRVPPEWFIGSAEQTDLIEAITQFVLDRALAQCRAWHEQGIPLRVAINASARNIHDTDFPKLVARALEAWGVEPGWLEVEITETSVLADRERTRAILQKLRSSGVQIALDDFGTGYSSLANLRNLPIDSIKLDRSFVREITSNDGDASIVATMIQLARHLGLRSVGEGVEDVATLDRLRALGCDVAQGYLVARPMSGDEISAFVHARADDEAATQP